MIVVTQRSLTDRQKEQRKQRSIGPMPVRPRQQSSFRHFLLLSLYLHMSSLKRWNGEPERRFPNLLPLCSRPTPLDGAQGYRPKMIHPAPTSAARTRNITTIVRLPTPSV